jgi:hypothetical protein
LVSLVVWWVTGLGNLTYPYLVYIPLEVYTVSDTTARRNLSLLFPYGGQLNHSSRDAR